MIPVFTGHSVLPFKSEKLARAKRYGVAHEFFKHVKECALRGYPVDNS